MTLPAHIPNQLVELPFGLPGRIFRSPMPDPLNSSSDNLLERYKAEKIDLVVNLLPETESKVKAGTDLRSVYTEAGFEMIGFPIQDFNVPEAEMLSRTLNKVIAAAENGVNLVVHCYAGIGRTGTFLACMAVKVFGIQGNQAVRWVRQYIPHAVENEAQLRFVNQFGEQNAHHER